MKLHAFVTAAVLSISSFAAVPDADTLRLVAEHYLAKKEIPSLEKGFSMEEGLATQKRFVELLQKDMGPVVGYKIGLITKQAQERLDGGPVHGVLLKRMLYANGAMVPSHYGARPAVELDMGVTVKDAGINQAKTLEEAIPHLLDLVCFIELVDTITATNQPVDAALLTALNVGARAGILGQIRRMTPELAEALPGMRMALLEEEGKVIAEVPKLNLQPLDNLPWFIADLNRHGQNLKPGDFISLGSPAAAQPVMPGRTIKLRYENLPKGKMEARVTFTQ